MKERFRTNSVVLIAVFSFFFLMGCDGMLQRGVDLDSPILKPAPLGGEGAGAVQVTDRSNNITAKSADVLLEMRNGFSYKLMEDVYLSKSVVVKAKHSASLDLNGYVLSGNGRDSVIINRGELSIYDSNPRSKNNFSDDGNGYVLNKNGDIVVDGGVITGGYSTALGGGGIYNNGKLVVCGGNIVGNKAELYGGGIRNNGGSVNINGGNVVGNSAKLGGAIADLWDEALFETYGEAGMVPVASGFSLTLKNGKIENNVSVSGGGIYSKGEKSVVKVEGGEILRNSSTRENGEGAAAHVAQGSEIYISGGYLVGSIFVENENNIAIRGGQFEASPPTEWLEEGFLFDVATGDVYNPNKSDGVSEVEVIPASGSPFVGTAEVFDVIEDGATYRLLGNIELKNDITVLSGVSITIDLNGFVLKGTGKNREVNHQGILRVNSVIYNGGTLRIQDSNPLNANYYDINENALWYSWNDKSGVLDIRGGCITGGGAERGSFDSVGGGIYNYMGTVIMEGGNIIGNSSCYGGGVYNESGSITLGAVNIVGNGAVHGGGMGVSRGNVVLNGAKIEKNFATSVGGGLYNNGGTVTMEEGYITENRSIRGGGLHNQNSSDFIMEQGVVSKNSAAIGAGISNRGSVTISGGKITANAATEMEKTAACGGGIFNDNRAELILSACTVEGNTSSEANGTAIYNRGTTDINDRVVIRQEDGRRSSSFVIYSDIGSVNVNGGGIAGKIARGNNGTLTVFGGYFDAKPDADVLSVGAAVGANGGVDTMYTAEEFPYTVTCPFVEVTSSGGKSSREVITVLNSLKSGYTYKLLSDTFLTSNIVVDQNLGVTLDLNGYVLQGPGETSVIVNYGRLNIIDSNPSAVHNFTKDTSGLYILGGANASVPVKGGIITGGNAKMGGGIVNDGTLVVEGCSIVGNIGNNQGGGVGNRGVATLKGTTVAGNIASEGMGGGISNLETLTLENAVIDNNKANMGDGGGVYTKGQTSINGGSISSNTAVYGGGIAVDGSAVVLIGGGKIESNFASESGGGISRKGGTVTVSGGIISANRAVSGGGIYSKSGYQLSITGGEIRNNITTGQGQAIYGVGGSINITGGGIQGTIYRLTSMTFVITGGYFNIQPATGLLGEGCVSSVNPGTDEAYPGSDYKYTVVKSGDLPKMEVILPTGSKSEVFVSDILKNLYSATAGTTYKLMYSVILDSTFVVPSSCDIKLDLNGYVLSNSVAGGSVISVDAGGKLVVEDSRPNTVNRYAADANGVLVSNGAGSVIIKGGAISGGTATHGGGIYNSGTTEIAGGNIVGNTATQGSGVYNSGDFKLKNGSIRGNSGGTCHAVYNAAGSVSVLGGGIVGTLAKNSGGIVIYGGYFGTEADTSFVDPAVVPVLNPGDNDLYPADVYGVRYFNSSVVPVLVATDFANLQDGVTYRLGSDITLTSRIEVPASTTMAIDLNGFILTGPGTDSVITNNGTLVIKDSNPSAQHNYNESNGFYSLVDGGSVIYKGGAIFGGYGASGAGIYNNGALTLEGGAILGNRSSVSGGGVFNSGENSSFAMRGGSILGNSSPIGSCVYNNKGTVSISNGGISGSIFNSDGNFTVSGGYFGENSYFGSNVFGLRFASRTDSDATYEKAVFPFTPLATIEMVDAAGVRSEVYSDVLRDLKDGYTYKLLADVGVGESLVVKEKEKVTLDLNGHVLKGMRIKTDGVIRVDEDATLNLMDSNGGVAHKYTRLSSGLYLWDDLNGGISIYGGSITGCENGSVPAIAVKGGVLNMNGGNLVGNNSVQSGGGLLVDDIGLVTMNKGSIVGNTASSGGGVAVLSGRFDIFHGSVGYNSAQESGGGVFARGGVFRLLNGEIMYNSAPTGSAISAEQSYDTDPERIVTSITLNSGGVEGSLHRSGDSRMYLRTVYLSEKPTEDTISGIFGCEENPGDSFGFPADPYAYKSQRLMVLKVTDANGENKYLYGDDLVTFDISEEDTGKTFQFARDFALPGGSLTIPESVNVTIDLNGFVLSGDGEKSVLTVNGALTLKDSNPTAAHKYSYDSSGQYHWDETGGGSTVNGGAITGGYSSTNGGGVYVAAGASLTMQGGNIVGNKTEKYGGGIYNLGTFSMTSGCITGNVCVSGLAIPMGVGGGLYNEGTAVLNGGEICFNRADAYGAGVYTVSSFTMLNGVIRGNTSQLSGGGISVARGGSAEISGGEIYENFTSGLIANGQSMNNGSGGGVYVNDGSITMSGGKVYSNTANDGSAFKVYNGTASISGGGVSGTLSRQSGTGTLSVSGGYFGPSSPSTYVISGRSVTSNSGTTDYPKATYPYLVR